MLKPVFQHPYVQRATQAAQVQGSCRDYAAPERGGGKVSPGILHILESHLRGRTGSELYYYKSECGIVQGEYEIGVKMCL
jgi:hypothetical protein